MRSLVPFLALLMLVQRVRVVSGALPISYYLGTCLTNEWVANMSLQVNLSAVDGQGRKKYPYIQKAVAKGFPRFQINDPRTASPLAHNPNCAVPGNSFFGANAQFDAKGNVVDVGQIKGSLIIEYDDWASHTLTTTAFLILAGEVLGYPIAEYRPFEYDIATERMTSVGLGICNPVHIDMEIWPAGIEQILETYSNESYCSGSIGYMGRSGVYVTSNLIKEGTNATKYKVPFSAEFWKDYRYNDELINEVRVSELWNNSQFYPPSKNLSIPPCNDGVLGCLNQCSKSYACTLREQQGKECMVVAMGYYGADAGYVQAVFANNQIPAYFCFIGVRRQGLYAVDMQSRGRYALFYYYYPSDFHYRYPGQFERLNLPFPLDDHVALSSLTFGENGYGKPTNNRVDVDFPALNLLKYGANLLLDHPPIATLFSRFTLPPTFLDELMTYYVEMSTAPGQTLSDNEVSFNAGCKWVRKHYFEWSNWLDPWPICTFDDVKYDCIEFTHNISGLNASHIVFHWKQPHPEDSSAPYACSGGVVALPPPKNLHFSCQELSQQPLSWLLRSRTCQSSDFYWTMSECDAQSYRTIHYAWKVPEQGNVSKSMECIGALPRDDKIECDHLPTNSRIYILQSVAAALAIVAFVGAMVLVHRLRDYVIISFGQPEMLQVMLSGGLLLFLFVFVQGGKPTKALCALRPLLLLVGTTCLVGPVMIKSYSTFHLAQFKHKQRGGHEGEMRRRAFVRLTLLLLIDLGFLVFWFVVDFPSPALVDKLHHDVAVANTVITDRICQSKSSMFTLAMLMWQTLILLLSGFFSLQIRHTSFDFGESFWLITCNAWIAIVSALIVVFTMGMSLQQWAIYALEHSLAIICAVVACAIMVVPKVVHRKTIQAEKSMNTSTGSNETGDTSRSGRTAPSGRSVRGGATGYSVHSKRSLMHEPTKPNVIAPINDSQSEANGAAAASSEADTTSEHAPDHATVKSPDPAPSAPDDFPQEPTAKTLQEKLAASRSTAMQKQMHHSDTSKRSKQYLEPLDVNQIKSKQRKQLQESQVHEATSKQTAGDDAYDDVNK